MLSRALSAILVPRLFIVSALAVSFGLAGGAAADAEGRVGVSATLAPGVAVTSTADFTSALSPYGTWVTLPGYGQVWQPSAAIVGTDFTPYTTAGSWLSTDVGWYFASDWSWGWAPFHYGQWLDDPSYGWVWIPGMEWGPAWVDWRIGGGYVGWAPLGPHRGVGDDSRHWRFVAAGRFDEPHVAAYAVQSERVAPVMKLMQPVPASGAHVRYSGPPVEYVQRAAGRPVRTVRVEAPRGVKTREAAMPEQARTAEEQRPARSFHEQQRPSPRSSGRGGQRR